VFEKSIGSRFVSPNPLLRQEEDHEEARDAAAEWEESFAGFRRCALSMALLCTPGWVRDGDRVAKRVKN
jgi:hypothetical protein